MSLSPHTPRQTGDHAGLDPSGARRLRRLDRLARLLDESIRIPALRYRIGYDALIGLLPGIGDAAGLLIGTYVVIEAARFRVPRSTLLRMVANVAIEAAVGTIPLIGDVFDATYKSNLRNVRLLRQRLDRPGEGVRSDRTFFWGVVAVPVVLALLLLAAVAAVLVALL